MTRDVSRFYDALAPFYPLLDLFLRRHKRRLAERINRESPGRLLEIGVGRGDMLKRYVCTQLTGIDASEGMLAFARNNAPPGCDLRVMDAADLAFADASFDYVVIAYVLSVVPDPAGVMAEAGRVLAPGGMVFILNHESAGIIGRAVGRLLAPLVARTLKFATTFTLDPVIDQATFTVVERSRSGIAPRISRLVLKKN